MDRREGMVPDQKKVAKVGTNLLVPPTLLKRAHALAEVRSSSIASVWLAALEGGGIAELEKRYATELAELRKRQSAA